MSPALTADQRLARNEKLFAGLVREHFALKKKYLELVTILFEMKPSIVAPHHRKVLAEQLGLGETEMKSDSPIGTNFSSSTTSHGNNSPAPGVTMMGPEGQRNAKAAAPISQSVRSGKIPTSGVDKLVQGEK
jgi:hypothetical protein